MALMTSVDLIDSRLSGFGGSEGRRVGLVGLPDLPDACSRSLYTHPAYLAAHGIGEVLLVAPRVTGSAREDRTPACFADCGRSLQHLGRLSSYDGPGLGALAGNVLQGADADFVVFEDIHLASDAGAVGWPGIRFDYKANWRLGIAPSDPLMSSAQRRKIRSKSRQLATSTGKEIRFEFSRATSAVVDRIVTFNRIKITRAHGRHHLDDNALSTLKTVCAEVGHQALLYCGDDLVSGVIMGISGTNAYMLVHGYGLEYAKFSPGLLAHAFALEQLQAQGCTVANLLWGDSPWKARMGATRHPLTTVIVARNRRALFSPHLLRACTPHAVAAARALLLRRVFGR